nr:tRNA epoxyqueuosine(34) reductase QueG [Tissierella sp.]
MNIERYIEDTSKKIGIDIIGFTDSSPLDLREILSDKRSLDRFTEFEEKDVEKRIDPTLTMENCRSIIVIGVSYNTGFKAENKHRLNGKISMSSWGEDYHRVLKDKMHLLIEELEKEIVFEYQTFADTGPLVDRELARRAGVGFFGKNCSIINVDYGSFIFLGYILTDMVLNPGISLKEDCGDCDLCLRACPTGALEQAFDLNPKRCISYLTQTKELIPEELRSKMGTNIYGCDRCQAICPKNKSVKFSSTLEFIPHHTRGRIDLEELLFISNKGFKRVYGSMAGSWRGKNILKRNAIIAIGNMKDEKHISLLEEVRKDANPMLEVYIDWAIENILTNSKKGL